uniref:Uncharacterized protein n=1 Tax=Sphaerodactylus townsendi TaxID=933632 RepID=A0ACB8FL27_9SAUR
METVPVPVVSELLAWPIDAPDAITTVTITPDFHGVHSGYITSLKKFTAYYTSILCFTTPGDGPWSPPLLLKTHEDKNSDAAGERDGFLTWLFPVSVPPENYHLLVTLPAKQESC